MVRPWCAECDTSKTEDLLLRLWSDLIETCSEFWNQEGIWSQINILRYQRYFGGYSIVLWATFLRGWAFSKFLDYDLWARVTDPLYPTPTPQPCPCSKWGKHLGKDDRVSIKTAGIVIPANRCKINGNRWKNSIHGGPLERLPPRTHTTWLLPYEGGFVALGSPAIFQVRA